MRITNYNLYNEIKKIEDVRDLYKKVLLQIATQPSKSRGRLSRELAKSVLEFVDSQMEERAIPPKTRIES